MKLKRDNSGFTLIEFAIIVILMGVLAAIALPKFTDVSDGARKAAANSVAAEFGSVSMINFMGVKMGSNNAQQLSTKDKCKKATDKQGGSGQAFLGNLPANYELVNPNQKVNGKVGELSGSCKIVDVNDSSIKADLLLVPTTNT